MAQSVGRTVPESQVASSSSHTKQKNSRYLRISESANFKRPEEKSKNPVDLETLT